MTGSYNETLSTTFSKAVRNGISERKTTEKIIVQRYFPANWNIRWAELYRDLNRYQREGKNLHDDCADALTGVAETVFMIYGD